MDTFCVYSNKHHKQKYIFMQNTNQTVSSAYDTMGNFTFWLRGNFRIG